jgi:hypothetical protein
MPLRWLTMEEQDRTIRSRFPGFRTEFIAAWGAQWTGELTPDSQRYRIQLRFIPGGEIGRVALSLAWPEVDLLDPPASRRSGAPDEPVPHTYGEGPPAKLCLWLPGTDEWSPAMPLAETIVPWASEWLFFYELWHATGIWYGCGVHPPRTT